MESSLYRSDKDRMIWGVCGGLAHHFKIDPSIVRLIFILTIFFGGLGIVAYIILAIVVPREGSQAGEPSETIKENVQEIKDTTQQIGKDIQSTLNSREKTAETRENREYDRNHSAGFIFGMVVLVIGIIALLSTTGITRWSWWFNWEYFWPAILILIGLLLIFRPGRKGARS